MSNEIELTKILLEIFPHVEWDDSVSDTARRIIGYWTEFSNGSDVDFNVTTFPSRGQQMIAVRDIEFSSMCAHHLLPFFGVAHVGYIPHELEIGLSKIPRIVDHYATRPQTQERMTEQIVSFLKHTLSAKGVAVVIESRHTCMACRGVRKMEASMVTSHIRGVFLTSPAPRDEFMNLIKIGSRR